MASRGLRDMDEGPEAIPDDAEAEAVRKQGRRVQRRALGVAMVTGLAALLIP